MEGLRKVQAVMNVLEEQLWVYSDHDEKLKPACQVLFDKLHEVIYEDLGFAEIINWGDDMLMDIVCLPSDIEWHNRLIVAWFELKASILRS